MQTIIKVVLIVSSLALIISVLMQSGKSAGMSGSIGGGAEQLFGKQKGATYDKLFDTVTKISAGVFIISALLISVVK